MHLREMLVIALIIVATISAAPLVQAEIQPPQPSLNVGLQQPFNATQRNTDGSALPTGAATNTNQVVLIASTQACKNTNSLVDRFYMQFELKEYVVGQPLNGTGLRTVQVMDVTGPINTCGNPGPVSITISGVTHNKPYRWKVRERVEHYDCIPGTAGCTPTKTENSIWREYNGAKLAFYGYNRAPTAGNDSFTTAEDTLLNGSLFGNDSDADGDSFQVVTPAATQSANGGVLSIADGGTFSYTPPADFIGTDSFSYQIHDQWTTSASATVTITVTPGNDPPVALGDSYTTDENTMLTVDAPGLLLNDTDADNDPLVVDVASATAPSNGDLVLNADGSFSYTPATGYSGPDSFTYSAFDGTTNSGPVTVTITVLSGNNPPAAAGDAFTVAANTTLTIAPAGVLSNDSDPDGDPLTIDPAGTSYPANGTLTLSTDGSFSYTPNPGFSGSDGFSYRAFDGIEVSNTATVTITVTEAIPSNNAPVAAGEAYLIAANTTLTVPASGVLGNDTDPDGDLLTVDPAGTANPANGTLTLNTNGSFSYTPNPGFSGLDGFSYRAFDGMDVSNTAAVTITVTPPKPEEPEEPLNNPPSVANDAYSTVEGVALTVPAESGVLANDTDPDGNPLSAAVLGGPTNGTLSLGTDGSFTYTPNAGFSGTDGFTYAASDGMATSAASVIITVSPATQQNEEELPPDEEPTDETDPDSETEPPVIVTPTSEPLPVVPAPVVWSNLPPCRDFDGTTESGSVLATVSNGTVNQGADVFCRIVVEDGVFLRNAGEIGNQVVLDFGVLQAIEVFDVSSTGVGGGAFNGGVSICLRGIGRMIYLNSANMPREPEWVASWQSGGFTCGTVPNAGTVVLVQ